MFIFMPFVFSLSFRPALWLSRLLYATALVHYYVYAMPPDHARRYARDFSRRDAITRTCARRMLASVDRRSDIYCFFTLSALPDGSRPGRRPRRAA